MAGLIVIGILFGIFAGTLIALATGERENLPKFIPLMFLISYVFIFLVGISPYTLEDKTEIYQLQKNVDGDYYKEIGNRITVTCKNYETGMNFPNDIVTFQETDSNPEIKIEGNVKKIALRMMISMDFIQSIRLQFSFQKTTKMSAVRQRDVKIVGQKIL